MRKQVEAAGWPCGRKQVEAVIPCSTDGHAVRLRERHPPSRNPAENFFQKVVDGVGGVV